MAITFHDSKTNLAATLHNVANASTTSITKPAVSAGDVLVVAFATNSNLTSTASSWAAPAGWTQVANSPNTVSSGTSFAIGVQLWWALQSVASTTFTFTLSGGSNDSSWVCLSFSGVDNVTPVDSSPAAGASSTGSKMATLTGWNTANDGALPVGAAVDWNAGSSFTLTGYTGVTTANSGSCELTALYKNAAISPAGATGNLVFTDGAAAAGNGIAALAFALKPAGSAGGGTAVSWLLSA